MRRRYTRPVVLGIARGIRDYRIRRRLVNGGRLRERYSGSQGRPSAAPALTSALAVAFGASTEQGRGAARYLEGATEDSRRPAPPRPRGRAPIRLAAAPALARGDEPGGKRAAAR